MDTLIELIKEFKNRDSLAMKYKTDYRTFSYSYRDLYEAINRCANFLKTGQRIAKGDKVAIWGPNSPAWVTAFFGIIAAGGVVVPIDNKAAPENASKIIANSGAKFVFKTRYRPDIGVAKASLEELEFIIEEYPPETEFALADKNDLVELVYTSGTTGDPKGVMITHDNLLSNITAVIRHIDVNERDQMISVLPLSHLFEQTCNMLAELYIGASIIYLETLKPSLIFGALAKERITLFIAVPRLLNGFKIAIRDKFSSPVKMAVFQALLRLGDCFPNKRKNIFFFIHKKFGHNFRFFVSGGAPLDADTEEFWQRLGFTVVQGYGLTECSPILTANQENRIRPGSVGRPLDNVELKLNPENEILARGPNISSGYYQDKEKTAAAFRDGWFLTGDIGVRDEDGFYYIKGRKKDVIVTADGFNVYPDDLEPLFNAQAEIKEACVIGLPDGNSEQVHAVIIPQAGKSDFRRVIDRVNEKLDSAQKIAGWSLWPDNDFPKTTTLKVKKNEVKASVLKQSESKEPGPEDADKLITMISEITNRKISEIDGKTRLAAELKLDSIGRVELVTRIEQEYNIDFDENLITAETTVDDLRAMINEKKKHAKKYRPARWPFCRPIRLARRPLLDFIGLPFMKIWCRAKVSGMENLKDLNGPVIFAPNHLSYFDQGAVLMALPKNIRHNLATAAWAEFFTPPKANLPIWLFKRFCYYASSLFFAVFPLSKEQNIKKNLEFIGELADREFNIMIFPEGERSMTDDLLPFKHGTAILAAALRLPVIPVGISGTEKVLPRKTAIPRRHRVKIAFGEPLYFKNQSIPEFLADLKERIDELRKD